MEAAPNWAVKDDIERLLSVFWTVHFHYFKTFKFRLFRSSSFCLSDSPLFDFRAVHF